MKGKFSKVVWLILVIMLIVAAVNIKTIGKHYFPMKYSTYIYKYSKTYNLDPYLVAAVIKTESDYNSNAKSSKDAYGLMQITAPTAEEIAKVAGITNFQKEKLFQPEYNIMIGCCYLEDLYIEFKNFDLVIAAYNGGRGNVKNWLSDSKYSKDGKTLNYIPYSETEQYLKKVKVYHNIYKWLYKR
jgi:soluble lytic murein transglycosylase